MVGYYAYIVSDDDRITGRVEIVCDDDDKAKRPAKRLVDNNGIELWQGVRKIEGFEPKNSILRPRLSCRQPQHEDCERGLRCEADSHRDPEPGCLIFCMSIGPH